MRLTELAHLLAVEIRGADPEVTRVSSIRLATPDALVFAENQPAFHQACASPAAAVIAPPALAEHPSAPKPLLIAQPAKLTFARAARLLNPPPPPSGIHPTALVSPQARLGEHVSVEPYAVIEAGAQLGPRTRIGAGAVLGREVRLGADCRIYPRVVLYPGTELGDRVVIHAGAVLGADGFGYVRDPATGEYLQFPQQGRLILEDDVEIGANTTIDRGALEETRIARGAKIDNLVHLGHNVQVGRNAVIAAQTGVSGSSSIGDGAVIGGQVGMGDHAAVGPGVILGGQAGILPHKNLLGPGEPFWGTPAQPLRAYLKELAAVRRLASGRRSPRPKEPADR
jgi:UDP-3-O-[3-hydroxymyristoyl] glucosamine N-acyltransferase